MSAVRSGRTAHAMYHRPVKGPALEIRLIVADPLNAPAWEYLALRAGNVIAASDGDAALSDPFAALVACIEEVEAALCQHGGDDGR